MTFDPGAPGLVRQVTTPLCVLETGRLITDGSTSEVLSSDLVRSVYLGR